MPELPKVSSRRHPSRRNWTSDQLKLAFAFYCQTPFGKLHSRNPRIVELAKLIGRTPAALAMKLVNFASLDPFIIRTGRKGLSGASAQDRAIWEEFHADRERLAVESERLYEQLLHEHGFGEIPTALSDEVFALDDYTGETRKAIVRQRIKQKFFRRAVLASYRSRCCISGVSDDRLLIASHIVPWSEDKANRLNPANGLCLSAIHDKAFDAHLFSLTDDVCVILSELLKTTKDVFLQEVFWRIDGKQIELPERFGPSQAFIQRHRHAMQQQNTKHSATIGGRSRL